MHEMIHTLYRYNGWANNRLIGSAKELDPAEFERDLGGSFPSIKNTLLHILWVEMLFMGRWRGIPTTDLAEPPNLDSVELIEGLWDGLEAARSQYLASLSDADLHTTIGYVDTRGRTISMPLWQSLMHLENHSSFHRGQVVSKLRQIGTTPPSTDFILFCKEHSR